MSLDFSYESANKPNRKAFSEWNDPRPVNFTALAFIIESFDFAISPLTTMIAYVESSKWKYPEGEDMRYRFNISFLHIRIYDWIRHKLVQRLSKIYSLFNDQQQSPVLVRSVCGIPCCFCEILSVCEQRSDVPTTGKQVLWWNWRLIIRIPFNSTDRVD